MNELIRWEPSDNQHLRTMKDCAHRENWVDCRCPLCDNAEVRIRDRYCSQCGARFVDAVVMETDKGNKK